MADKEPPRTPWRYRSKTPLLPVEKKLSRSELLMLAAMREPAQVKKVRKICEELQRDHDNEQRLVDAADLEETGGSVCAGTRDHESANEENADMEEDIDHGRNDNATYTQYERVNTANTGVSIPTSGLSCGDCRLDGTMS
jgi:hypothetical protein